MEDRTELHYWLMKSEPSVQSIDDLAGMPDGTVGWFGVRNYQARNFMRDNMQDGDMVFFYHSSCPEPGIAGIARVVGSSYPDPTQFDPRSEYFDPTSPVANPRWIQVNVQFVRKTRLLGLAELRAIAGLEAMRLLQKGNRLSITPVTPSEGEIIQTLLA